MQLWYFLDYFNSKIGLKYWGVKTYQIIEEVIAPPPRPRFLCLWVMHYNNYKSESWHTLLCQNSTQIMTRSVLWILRCGMYSNRMFIYPDDPGYYRIWPQSDLEPSDAFHLTTVSVTPAPPPPAAQSTNCRSYSGTPPCGITDVTPKNVSLITLKRPKGLRCCLPEEG